MRSTFGQIELDKIMAKSSMEADRRLSSGVSSAEVRTRNTSSWTQLLIAIALFLSVSSSADCLPLELANSVVEPSKYSSVGGQQESGDRMTGSNYQLVHQGQLYLPALFQNERLGGSQGSDYPISSQNEDDSIGTEWETVIDPHLYVLNEWRSSRPRVQQKRKKRSAGPSLSIVNPLDVLRQRLLLEIARRKMIKSQNQILANAEILKNIGRRRR